MKRTYTTNIQRSGEKRKRSKMYTKPATHITTKAPRNRVNMNKFSHLMKRRVEYCNLVNINDDAINNVLNEDYKTFLYKSKDGIYVPTKELGQGAYGRVVELCKKGTQSCKKVMKLIPFIINNGIQSINIDELINEVGASSLFGEYSPDIEFVDIEYNNTIECSYAIIVMGRVNCILYNFLKIQRDFIVLLSIFSNLIRLITFMIEHNISHGDMHTNNIGANPDGLVLIDFGKVQLQSNPQADTLDLIRGLAYKFKDNQELNDYNRETLLTLLVMYYNDSWEPLDLDILKKCFHNVTNETENYFKFIDTIRYNLRKTHLIT